VNWQVILTKQAVKDARKIAASGLKKNAQKLIETLERDPYEPPYEKLIGNLQGYYSRRINIQHRLVYAIDEEKRIIKILKMWTHYE
jgi:Txe/YoeB family toxin of toxin-antitoxin system